MKDNNKNMIININDNTNEKNVSFFYNQKNNEIIYNQEKHRFKSFYDYVAYSYMKKNGYKNIEQGYETLKSNSEIQKHFKNVISRAQKWNDKTNIIQETANNSNKKIREMNSQEFKEFLKKNKLEGKDLKITTEDRVNMYWYQTYQSFKQAKPAASIMYVTDFRSSPEYKNTDKEANNLFSRLLMEEDLFAKVNKEKGLEIPDEGLSRNLRAIGDFFKAISNKLFFNESVYEKTYARQSSHYKNIRIHHGWDFSKENSKLTGISNNVMCYGQFKNAEGKVDGGAVYSKPESHGANPNNFEEFVAHGLNFLKGDKGKEALAKQREVDINPKIAENYFKFVTEIFKTISKSSNYPLFIPRKESLFNRFFFNKSQKLMEKICKKSGIWSNGSRNFSIHDGQISKNKKNAQLIIKNKTDITKINQFLNYVREKIVFNEEFNKKINSNDKEKMLQSFNEFDATFNLYKKRFEGGFLPQGSEIVINNSKDLYNKDKKELERLEKLINTGDINKLINTTSRKYYLQNLETNKKQISSPKQKIRNHIYKEIRFSNKAKTIKLEKNNAVKANIDIKDCKKQLGNRFSRNSI